MRGKGIATTAVVLAVVAVLWVLLQGDSPREPSGRPSPQSQDLAHREPGRPDRDKAPAPRRAALPERESGALRDSGALRGTEIDGALPVDGAGHLVIAPDLIRFFDYFFVDSGSTADAVIRRRLEAEIDGRLQEPARSEALQLLEKYLRYRAAAAGLYAADRAPATLGERIAAIAELREEIFGADAAVLFGPDLEHARIAAEMQRIASQSDLATEERAARLRALEAELPEEVRAARDAATAARDLARDENELRAAGGDDEEVRALREERFGAAAADRLAALDERRADWRRRVDEFRRSRSEIEAQPSLTEEQRAARIGELLEGSFAENERQRILALDRIELGR